MRWDDCSMPARAKTTMRFLFFPGLLLLEASLVVAFYVVPQFQTHVYDPHPNIGLENRCGLTQVSKSAGCPHCILGNLLVWQHRADHVGVANFQEPSDGSSE